MGGCAVVGGMGEAQGGTSGPSSGAWSLSEPRGEAVGGQRDSRRNPEESQGGGEVAARSGTVAVMSDTEASLRVKGQARSPGIQRQV